MDKIDFVKELRSITGVGLVEAVGFFQECNGDMNAAIEKVKAKGLLVYKKKADRPAEVRRVFSYVHDNKIGVLVVLSCETDFSAKTDAFNNLGHELCLQVCASYPANGVCENAAMILEQEYVRNNSLFIKDLIADVSRQIGENVQIVAFSRINSSQL